MENILTKIKTIGYSEKESENINKFLAPLSDEIVSIDEIVQILNYLKANNIIISKPSQNKIFARGYEYVKATVEEYKAMGIVNALIEDPIRINAQDSIKRIKFLMDKEIKLTKPNGRYLKLLFSKTLFEKEYGGLDGTPKEFDPLQDNLYKSEDVSISSLFKQDNSLDEYLAVLNAPQVPADDEAIKVFDELYNYTEKILTNMYGSENKVSVPDNTCECLMKLAAQKYNDKKKMLFYSLTYGKNISNEEKNFIDSEIDKVLNSHDEYQTVELESIA